VLSLCLQSALSGWGLDACGRSACALIILRGSFIILRGAFIILRGSYIILRGSFIILVYACPWNVVLFVPVDHGSLAQALAMNKDQSGAQHHVCLPFILSSSPVGALVFTVVS
jgi:hypothetical protein